jgi:hypothetical protein
MEEVKSMSQDQEKNTVASCHQSHSGQGHFWHMALMILCCLIPLGIVFIAPKFGVPLKFSWLVTLLCPVMMVWMMVMMCLPRKEKK